MQAVYVITDRLSKTVGNSILSRGITILLCSSGLELPAKPYVVSQ